MTTKLTYRLFIDGEWTAFAGHGRPAGERKAMPGQAGNPGKARKKQRHPW
jgi:hypothetical protein